MSAQDSSSLFNFGTTKSYQIPIEHLEYNFIDKCKDIKHLEKILHILRSGEEGHYPDLIDFCEKRIESLAPQSRALRKDKPLATAADFSVEEWQHINNDIKHRWLPCLPSTDGYPASQAPMATLPPKHRWLPCLPSTDGYPASQAPMATLPPKHRWLPCLPSTDGYPASQAPMATLPPKHRWLPCLPSTDGYPASQAPMATLPPKHRWLPCLPSTDGYPASQAPMATLPPKHRWLPCLPSTDGYPASQAPMATLPPKHRWLPCLPSTDGYPASQAPMATLPPKHRWLPCLPSTDGYPASQAPMATLPPKHRWLPCLPSTDGYPASQAPMDWLTDLKMKDQQKPDFQHDIENIPPIRTYPVCPVTDKRKGKENKTISSKVPRDYKDWDRFDVDKELNKVEEGSEEKASSKTGINSSSIKKKINTEGISPEQRSFLADREREKGNEAFRSGDYEEAVSYYSRSISVLPSASAYNNRAQAEIKLKNWQNAMNDCQKVLDLEPLNLKALLRRATVHKNVCRYQAAADDLKIVLDHEPGNPSAQKLLGEVNGLLKKTEETAPRKGKRITIQDIEDSGEESGKEEPNHDQETGVTVGGETAGERIEMGNAQKKFSPKRDIHTKEGCNSPKLSKAQNGLQKGYSNGDRTRNGCDEKQSQERLSKADPGTEIRNKGGSEEVQQSSLNLPAAAKLKAVGNQLFKNGQFGDAALKYSEAIENVKNTGAESAEELGILYSNRAACHLKDGDCRECIEDCNRALELQPFSIKPLLRRAMANEALERYRQAYVDYKTVLQIDCGVQVANDSINRITRMLMDQDGPKWRENLPPIPAVPVSFQVQRQEGASVSVSSGVQSVNSSENKKPEKLAGEAAKEKFLSLKQKGNEYVQKGQYKEAEQKYTECLEINPEECALYTNRALCYLKLGQYEEARQDCECALQKDVSNIKALYRRAQAYRGLENYQACANDLQKLLSIDPSVAEAKKQLDEVTSLLSAGSIPTNGQEKQRKKILIEEVDEKEETTEKVEVENTNDHSAQDGHENNVPLATSRSHLIKPTNAYEFGQLLNEMRAGKNVAACAELLSTIEPKDLPEFLSNKLEGDTFLLIVRSLKHSLLDKDPQLLYKHLSHLSKADRFKVVVMLLNKNEKEEIQDLLESLSGKQIDSVDPEDVLKLAKEYEL
ncbi:sperm-associated antigen 1 [Discoglossus pictus]